MARFESGKHITSFFSVAVFEIWNDSLD